MNVDGDEDDLENERLLQSGSIRSKAKTNQKLCEHILAYRLNKKNKAKRLFGTSLPLFRLRIEELLSKLFSP